LTRPGLSYKGDGLQAVIPVQPFGRAKSRLSPVLSPNERCALAEAMFRDVLAAVFASRLFDAVHVATGCEDAARIAREAGASVLPDASQSPGTNGAVDAALAKLPLDAAVMVVQADLPLLQPTDLVAVAAALRNGAEVVLVPAMDGGTTILGLSPARAIRSAFGPNSFAAHMAQAGSAPVVLRPGRAVFDLDRPEDIALLLACRSDSHCIRLSHLARAIGLSTHTTKQENTSHVEGDHARYASVR